MKRFSGQISVFNSACDALHILPARIFIAAHAPWKRRDGWDAGTMQQLQLKRPENRMDACRAAKMGAGLKGLLDCTRG
jgi:hypothetical protein